MGKTSEKLNMLRNMFAEGSELSVSDICKHLNINRSRAYDYINKLTAQGISLNTKQVDRKSIYYLASEPPASSLYTPLSPKDITIFRILSVLGRTHMVAEDLYKEFFRDTIPQSSFYNLINALIKNGQIAESIKYEKSPLANNNRLYKRRYLSPTGIDTSLIIDVDVEAQNLINAYVASGQSQSAALRRLREKIAILLGDNTVFSIDENIFLQYGRGYHMGDDFQKYYHLLMDNHYRTNVLDFYYRQRHMQFSTGMAVYSQDKDMIYLIGRIARSHNTTILRVDDISNLTYIERRNDEYDLPKYHEYLQNMFSISTEKPYEVEILFENTPANHSRLRKLCKLRINGRLTERSNDLIYQDTISGLSDFAVYLRSFGNSYTVINPPVLKEMLQHTLERSLTRYY